MATPTSSLHRFANPQQFQRIAAVLMPVSALLALAMGAWGLANGLFYAPADATQGEVMRIMYIHVPAAWMSSMTYGFMALMSASFLVWRHTLADVLARAAAPIGMVFTLVTLATGMLWGKPTWGAYWVWDARLTSMAVLLLMYIGYLGLAGAGVVEERVKNACAWLCLVGAINLPIIKFSVEWWNTLHQPASIIRRGGASIAPEMLHPLLWVIGAFMALFVALLCLRADTLLKQQKLRRLQIQKIARKNAAIE